MYQAHNSEGGILCARDDSTPKGESVSVESAVVLWPCSIGTLPSAGMVVVVLLVIYCCRCRRILQPAVAWFSCLVRPTELDPRPGLQLGGSLRLPCRSAGWLLAWLSATRVRLVTLGTAVGLQLFGRTGHRLTVPDAPGWLSRCMVILYLLAAWPNGYYWLIIGTGT